MRDGVRPLRHQRTGHDADGRPRVDALRSHRAGRQVLHHRQPHWRAGNVLRPHGVTVHGGVVALRYVGRGEDVLPQYAAQRLGERHPLGADQLDLRQHALLRLFHGDHPLAGAGCLEGGHQ